MMIIMFVIRIWIKIRMENEIGIDIMVGMEIRIRNNPILLSPLRPTIVKSAL